MAATKDRHGNPHSKGPPTKFTPARVNVLLEAIKLGMPVTHAIRKAGISNQVYYDWRQRHPEFDEAIKAAEAELIESALRDIHSATREDWRAAGWLLERRFQDTYGKRPAFQSEKAGDNYTINVRIEGDPGGFPGLVQHGADAPASLSSPASDDVVDTTAETLD